MDCLTIGLIAYSSLSQVERSKALLVSLADERERWDAGSEAFKSQMSTITGDVLLTSAFMAYGGEHLVCIPHHSLFCVGVCGCRCVCMHMYVQV